MMAWVKVPQVNIDRQQNFVGQCFDIAFQRKQNFAGQCFDIALQRKSVHRNVWVDFHAITLI